MRYIIKQDFTVEIKALQRKLIDNPALFGLNEERISMPENSPHRESSDIWVRYGDYHKFGSDVFKNEHDSVWFPILNEIEEILPIVFKVMSRLHGERLGGVLITKLEKGKKIYPHTDKGSWHPDYYDKFFVPILNKKGAIFSFKDTEDIIVQDGEVYWFRNDVPHWVNNNSDSDRIALIICLKPFRGVTNGE